VCGCPCRILHSNDIKIERERRYRLEQDFTFHYPPALRKLRKTQYSMSRREFKSLPVFATTVVKDVWDEDDLMDVEELRLEMRQVNISLSMCVGGPT
jgi:hypothetical protein